MTARGDYERTAPATEARAEAQHREHVRRARAAIEALREAGAEKLHKRLAQSFLGPYYALAAVMAQARSWSTCDADTEEPARAKARDAVGLLWAVMEEMDLARVGREIAGKAVQA